jgi:hypothetical protein
MGYTDLTGRQFGKLTVLKLFEKRKNLYVWECKCNCEKQTITTVYGCNLTSGHTTSCGCNTSESTKLRNKKYNEFLEMPDCMICKCKNGEFFFDKELYEEAKKYYWVISGRGYARSQVNGKHIYFHKLAINVDSKIMVDHIDKNSLNNKSANLRVADKSKNAANSKNRKNTSGFTGVSFNRTQNNWIANIKINGIFHQKKFKNIEDAIIQRLNWEKEFFKEFAPQQNLFEQYGIV